MKTLLLSLTAVILASTFAQGASDLVPSFKGKIHNHTSIPTDKLKVRVELDCSYSSGFVWPESKSCGNEVQYVQVQADGTYIVPAMKRQKKSNLKNYRYSYSVSSDALYPESIDYVFFDAKEIQSAPAKLTEISIYQVPEINVNVVTPTGEDYATWRGMIKHTSELVKDPCVELIYHVAADAQHQIHNEYDLSELVTDKKSAGKLPSLFFATKGNPGKDLKVTSQLYYRTSKPTCEVNSDEVKFNSTIVATGSISEVTEIFNNSTYKVD